MNVPASITGDGDTADLESGLAQIRTVHKAHWPAEVLHEVHYPVGTDGIVEHLRHWAGERPDHPAILFYGRTVTYAILDALPMTATGKVRKGD